MQHLLKKFPYTSASSNISWWRWKGHFPPTCPYLSLCAALHETLYTSFTQDFFLMVQYMARWYSLAFRQDQNCWSIKFQLVHIWPKEKKTCTLRVKALTCHSPNHTICSKVSHKCGKRLGTTTVKTGSTNNTEDIIKWMWLGQCVTMSTKRWITLPPSGEHCYKNVQLMSLIGAFMRHWYKMGGRQLQAGHRRKEESYWWLQEKSAIYMYF